MKQSQSARATQLSQGSTTDHSLHNRGASAPTGVVGALQSEADHSRVLRPLQRLQEQAASMAQGREAAHMPSPMVQRKLMVGDSAHTPAAEADDAVVEASKDEFVRYYTSTDEMNAHLVEKTPSAVGLIPSRALWYRLPYLSQEFFVFGESHAGVKGGAIKAASNIKKPILDEEKQGWNVNDPVEEEAPTEDQGLDENSSKLLRAVELWNPKLPSAATGGGSGDAYVPPIPEGEASARDVARGTYRLAVRGNDGAPEWWKPKGAQEAPQNTYNTQDEAYVAITGLFPVVFSEEIKNAKLDDYTVRLSLSKAYDYFGMLYNKSSDEMYPGGQPHPKWINIATAVKNAFAASTQKKLKENYLLHQKGAPKLKAPDSDDLKTADDYRNEFIFSRVLAAKTSGAYAFATMGNNHLRALQSRFDDEGIPYVTMEQFYGTLSKVAVDLS